MSVQDSEALFYQLAICQIQEGKSPEPITQQDRDDNQKEVDRIAELGKIKFIKLGESQKKNITQTRTKRMALQIYN